jgi:hypothetical protein
MNGESLAIIAIILLMAGIFLRAKRKGMALLSLPLISVPVFHLATLAVSPLARGMGYDAQSANMGLIVIGVVVGSAACSLLSRIITSRRGQNVYLVFSLLSQVAIAVGYMINLPWPA